MSDKVTPFTRSLDMARKLNNVGWGQCKDTLDHLVLLNPLRAAAISAYLQNKVEQHAVDMEQYAMEMEAANNDTYGDRA